MTDPSIERGTITAVLDDLAKELDHVFDVGPDAVARRDLAADGGRGVDVKKLKQLPSVLVDCRVCGDPFEVDARTFDLALDVGRGWFSCDGCLSVGTAGGLR